MRTTKMNFNKLTRILNTASQNLIRRVETVGKKRMKNKLRLTVMIVTVSQMKLLKV